MILYASSFMNGVNVYNLNDNIIIIALSRIYKIIAIIYDI